MEGRSVVQDGLINNAGECEGSSANMDGSDDDSGECTSDV